MAQSSKDKKGFFRRVRRPKVKSITILPSLITLINGLCGFAAIVFAGKAMMTSEDFTYHKLQLSYFALSGYMILIAMIADVLDGRVARMSQNTSSFGGQLDSLCDIISFGVAPAFLMFKILEHKLMHVTGMPAFAETLLTRFIWISAAAYVCCAAIRLARFNVENEESEASHRLFVGLPSPAAAGVIVSLVILQQETVGEITKAGTLAYEISEGALLYALPFVTLMMGVAMISRIPYLHLLNIYMRGRKPMAYLLMSLMVIGLIIWYRQIALVIGFCGFAAGGFFKWTLKKSKRSKESSSQSTNRSVETHP